MIATDGEISHSAEGTVLSVMLAAAIPYRLDVMARPDRIVVDLPEVNFQLAPDFGKKPTGLIKSARFGLFAAGPGQPLRTGQARLVNFQQRHRVLVKMHYFCML
mgnify:CR=1 FL=1